MTLRGTDHNGLVLTSGLTSWLSSVLGSGTPFHLRPVGVDRTCLLVRAGEEWILRTAGVGPFDTALRLMRREQVVTRALFSQGVPVLRPLALCVDSIVPGAPILLLDSADGEPITFERSGNTSDGATIEQVGQAVVDALVALQSLDHGQLPRDEEDRVDEPLDPNQPHWSQLADTNGIGLRGPVLRLERIAQWLRRSRPLTVDPALQHGQFAMQQCLLTDQPFVRVSGIVGWGKARLGDPLEDLGSALASLEFEGGTDGRTCPSPIQIHLAMQYAEATGRSVANLPYYLALGYWRFAIAAAEATTAGNRLAILLSRAEQCAAIQSA